MPPGKAAFSTVSASQTIATRKELPPAWDKIALSRVSSPLTRRPYVRALYIYKDVLGAEGKTRQIHSCRPFCVQAHIACSSTPETAASRLTCMSNATETRQNTGSNLLLTLESSSGFSRGELMDIYRLISDQRVALLEKWHDYFGN